VTRATLTLTRTCNNRCVFCAQDGLEPIAEAEASRSLRALAERATEVTFVGGEPTLRADLPELIAAARTLGFERVGLQTNARRLSDSAFTAQLASAGLTDVHVTVLGAEPAVHDFHTGAEGSFRELLAGVAAARARGVTVVATTVLTRSNYRVLNALPPLLASLGVSGWQVTTPLVAGRAVKGMDPVVPRLALALPYALHALAAAQKLGLRAVVSGAPWCLLGPFAAQTIPSGRRALAPPCEACPVRDRCPGVDAPYLARFGDDELAPLASVPVVAALDATTRLFTGPGDTWSPPNLEVPPPPSVVRSGIPSLGKGAPAAAEVSGPVRKSGEALKTIFPGLFKPDQQG
jgi:hypothetical protein